MEPTYKTGEHFESLSLMVFLTTIIRKTNILEEKSKIYVDVYYDSTVKLYRKNVNKLGIMSNFKGG